MAHPGSVICLYEHSGLSAKPWAEAGYDVWCYDIANENEEIPCGKGTIVKRRWDAHTRDAMETIFYATTDQVLVLGFPPCDDLAVSGAKHFQDKLRRDPDVFNKAMRRVHIVRNIADWLKVPYAIENPKSRIATLWRKADYIWSPHQYAGYLPEDDVHPVYPEIIEPRDQYQKETHYWIGNGFIIPPRDPRPPLHPLANMYTKLGGNSERTKRIRNSSPRGMAQAIFEFNRKD